MSHKKSRKKNSSNHSQDISLCDFADSKYISSRSKKSVGNLKKDLTKEPMSTLVDWDWDDNVDDDIDLVEQENEDGTKSIIVARSDPQTKCRRIPYNERPPADAEGVEYPIVVWFLISEYIKPEDVGRFAGICQSTLYVTSYAKFWYNLYKRYCKKTNNCLPEGLKPESIARRYSLRSLVIRSLYYTYLPFVCRSPPQSSFCTPQNLIKRRCVSMWYHRYKDQWIFYFKMKTIHRKMYGSRQESGKKDLLTILDDINANQEADCKVLKVFCGNFSQAPPAMGMILKTIQTSLAANMRNHRLSLGFSSGYQDLLVGVPECFVVLDTVVKMQVIDWWHQSYPHSTEILSNFTNSHEKNYSCAVQV